MPKSTMYLVWLVGAAIPFPSFGSHNHTPLHILSPIVFSPWLESFSLFAHKCNHPQPTAACPKHTTVV